MFFEPARRRHLRRTLLTIIAALLLVACGNLERPTPPAPAATWTPAAADTVRALSLPSDAIAVQYAADGQTLAVLTKADLLLIDSQSWQPLWQHPLDGRSGGLTITAAGAIHVIVWQPSGSVAVQSRHADGSDAGLAIVENIEPIAAALSPDAGTLALADAQNELMLYDPSSGTTTPLTVDGNGQIMLLAFSPDGKRLVADFSRGSSVLVDVDTGQTLQQLGEFMEARSAAFTRDGGKLAIAWWGPPLERATDGGHEWIQPQGLQLWAIPGGRILYEEVDLDRTIGGIAAIPGNELIAIAQDNGTITIRRWADGGQVATLDVDTRRIGAIAAAPDGQTLAVAGQDDDGRQQLWQLPIKR